MTLGLRNGKVTYDNLFILTYYHRNESIMLDRDARLEIERKKKLEQDLEQCSFVPSIIHQNFREDLNPHRRGSGSSSGPEQKVNYQTLMMNCKSSSASDSRNATQTLPPSGFCSSPDVRTSYNIDPYSFGPRHNISNIKNDDPPQPAYSSTAQIYSNCDSDDEDNNYGGGYELNELGEIVSFQQHNS